jgi:probable addiction module antidote protein
MNMIKTRPFDAAEYLDNPEVIAHYLADAFQSHNSKLILAAIQDVMRAQKMTAIARATGRSRTSLYWRKQTSPEFTTVLDVLGALDVQLVPMPTRKRRAPRDVVIASRTLDRTTQHVHIGVKSSAKPRKKK